MEANSLTRFAQACGAVRPIDLALERPNGTIAKACSITQPFAVIGSDPYCDLHLPNSGLAPRHAALQVIAGNLFIFDISGQGKDFYVNNVQRSDGWLTEHEPAIIAGHRLILNGPIAPPIHDLTSNFQPLIPNAEIVSRFPKSYIEFRNGRTSQNRWEINRILTFVGRAKQCKINLTSEDVSLFHCYFLLTTDGVWVVDTFGRGGISINGISQRFYRLSTGDEVQVARFMLACGYPNGDPGEPIIALTPAAKAYVQPEVYTAQKHYQHSIPAPASSNPSPIPLHAQSSSSAYNFDEQSTESGNPSTPSPRVEMPKDLVIPGNGNGSGNSQVAITGQMFEQFQQNMLMMMQMFGQMHQQQMAGIQQEMSRLSSLTEEISKMQGEIAKAVNPEPVVHHNPLPDPEAVPGVSDETAGQHEQIFNKIHELEAERASIWHRLSGIFTSKQPTPQ